MAPSPGKGPPTYFPQFPRGKASTRLSKETSALGMLFLVLELSGCFGKPLCQRKLLGSRAMHLSSNRPRANS